ncbi:MAG: DNA polymerase III subunit beta, partial [Minisyncoccia bacterium]
MKIECIKERLNEVLGKAEKIAVKNPTLPALSGVYLKAENNTLSIRTTNLDLGFYTTIPVKVIEPGEVVVPAQIISSFLNSLPKEKNIIINTNGQTLLVKTGNTETNIKTLSTEDFPIIPTLKNEESFSLPIKDFILGLKSVNYAAAIGSMKPELSSVYIYHEDEFLIFAATDSFRLAEKKIKIKKTPNFKYILIPQKNISEIIRMFDSVDDDVSLSIQDNQIAFFGGGICLTSRIIEGIFPDYRQIIPKETTTKTLVLKQDLNNSLKTAMIFSDSFNQLKITISKGKKIFEVESKNTTVGENKYDVDAIIEGEDLSININQKYLTDCFVSVPGDTISLKFNGQTKPIIVEGVGDKSFLYL